MDPHYFPFEIITQDKLISSENYYIKLNDKVIDKFLTKRQPLPVSHLKGKFIRLHTETSGINNTDYAVFKNVQMMNRNYRFGLCNQMLIRYPEGYLATTGCDTYSDRDRTINENREVYFDISKWIFGLPTETALITNQLMRKKIYPSLDSNTLGQIEEFRGTNKGGKTRNKKSRGKKRKIYRRRRTNKRM